MLKELQKNMKLARKEVKSISKKTNGISKNEESMSQISMLGLGGSVG